MSKAPWNCQTLGVRLWTSPWIQKLFEYTEAGGRKFCKISQKWRKKWLLAEEFWRPRTSLNFGQKRQKRGRKDAEKIQIMTKMRSKISWHRPFNLMAKSSSSIRSSMGHSLCISNLTLNNYLWIYCTVRAFISIWI